MKRPHPVVPRLLAAGFLAGVATASEPVVVTLWPAGTPGVDAAAGPETVQVEEKGGVKTTRISAVTNPSLAIHAPAGAAAEPRPAVVICPGGGYGILAYDKEGTEVAAWLNGLGLVGAVLKYRVPKQREAAFQDAQRAVRLVRSRAAEWGIDPKRVGLLGFSAGGHLAARVCTHFKTSAYERVDGSDDVSCRPDFAVLVYPAYLETEDGKGLDTATLPVAPETPPTFIAIAFNDKFTPGALRYFQALREAKVRSELHVYQFGGHGCGLRPSGENMTTWPEACARWLRGIGAVPGR